MWAQIAGAGFVAAPVIQADWQPVPTYADGSVTCPTSGFTFQSATSYSPVWVAQGGSVNGVDGDQAC